MQTTWNGWIAQRANICERACHKKKTTAVPNDWVIRRDAERMSRLCRHVIDSGLITVRKAAEVMRCNIEDITQDI